MNERNPRNTSGLLTPSHRHRRVTAGFTACMLLLAVSQTTRTANADDKSRRIVGGILRILVDSQVQRGHRGNLAQQNLAPRGQLTPELTRCRPQLVEFSREATGLSTILQRDAAQNHALRPLAAQTLQFQAETQALARRSTLVNDHRAILAETQRVDRDWRLLSYRLQQTQGLTGPCRECVGRLDRMELALCESLSIEPQIDRRTLLRHGQELSLYLRGLVEDIDFELRRSPQREALKLAASKAHQAAAGFAEDVAEGAGYDELVAAYREFLNVWNPLVRTLCSAPTRYIERTVLRIQPADQAIHELLWLPRGIDRQVLAQLTAGIMTEVDQIFEAVTLNVLVALPGRDQIPSAASDFYGVCEHFADCVESGEKHDELIDAYGYLTPAWVSFSRHFRRINHSGIRGSISEIEKRLVALREPLGVPGSFSHEEARDLAASLERLSGLLEQDIEVWLRNKEYGKERQVVVEHCRQFRSSAREIHTMLLGDVQGQNLRNTCATAYSKWEQLHGRISECDAPGRENLAPLLVRISERLVSIEAMFL